MKLDKNWNGLVQIANGDYVLEGDLIVTEDEDLEVELDDLLVVKGMVEVKRSLIVRYGIDAGCGIKAGEGIDAGCGIKAGEGINAGWGIKAGTYIYCKKRIFAGLSVFRTSADCDKRIICSEFLGGEIAYGELVIVQKRGNTPD